MSNSPISKMYEEVIKDGMITCTESELCEFLDLGYLFKSGDKYYDRLSRNVCVKIVSARMHTFNIKLNELLQLGNSILSAQHVTNKIYFVTKKTYNLLKSQNLIIQYKGIDYYRLFENELWLIHII